ncbi:MAG: glycosyltransferase [Bacteroidetes bacterium]|nr:glycosyltransferase [Bacteroidota bacterium]
MSRILHLYTLSYPFGQGEGFIENELHYLARRFENVLIHPWNFSKEVPRKVPDNVFVKFIEPSRTISFPKRLRMILPYLSKSSFRKNWRYELAHAGRLLSMADALKESRSSVDSVHYSYWLSDWATVLGLVHAEDPRFKYQARAHGFDVYDERQLYGEHLYRDIQIKGLQKLYPISDLAKTYLMERHDGLDAEVQHLGTIDHGMGPYEPKDTLRVISCSTISELKRVHLIPELLKSLGRPVHWTHIGDGPMISIVRQIMEQENNQVRATLLGFITPDQVAEVYKEIAFDIFLHLSSSEGIPVSMMEAISFGIPIVATEVGAVPEIVNNSTGNLLAEELDMESWTTSLQKALDSLPNRASVRMFWEENFKAETNYPIFAQKLYES